MEVEPKYNLNRYLVFFLSHVLNLQDTTFPSCFFLVLLELNVHQVHVYFRKTISEPYRGDQARDQFARLLALVAQSLDRHAGHQKVAGSEMFF